MFNMISTPDDFPRPEVIVSAGMLQKISFADLRNGDSVQHALGLRYSRPVGPRLVPNHAERSNREEAIDEPQPPKRRAVAHGVFKPCEVVRVGGSWKDKNK